MKADEVRKRAFAMPLTNPAFPPGPYRFVDREFLIVTYRTDPVALADAAYDVIAAEGLREPVRLRPEGARHPGREAQHLRRCDRPRSPPRLHRREAHRVHSART